jgi:Protein of unknown function (DUF2961)
MRLNGKNFRSLVCVSALFLMAGCKQAAQNKSSVNDKLFVYTDNMEPRWSSPENKNGEKSAGGKENNGAKGHAFDSIPAGASLELLNVQQQGIINRIWITVGDRSAEMLRSLKIEMFWDNEKKPAVSVPFGDFFGVGLGRTTVFQNTFFANPEGRSFNCFIPMPFKQAARIVITNESHQLIQRIFFDVDYNVLKSWDDDYMYFHAFWQRDTATVPAKDFDMLPPVNGRGRWLGVNVGVNANPMYKKSWFGEGEVKIYLDDDKDLPTLNGTGTEDYIGTAWGQGKFINTYTGCTIADDSLLQWAFYRYHVTDPIYFKTGCRAAIQQLGGEMTNQVTRYQKSGAAVIPVTIDTGKIVSYYEKGKMLQLDSTKFPMGWTNYYRSDDVSATAYFYLDKPSDNLPALQPVNIRTYKLRVK